MLGNGQIVPYREKLDTYAKKKTPADKQGLWYTICAATSNPGFRLAGREVSAMSDFFLSLVAGILSSLIANWLYDKTRKRGK